MVTLLLAGDRLDPNIANHSGDTALMVAAINEHASVVTVLLADKRVDPNIANQYDVTALTWASAYKQFLDAGAPPRQNRTTRIHPSDQIGAEA